MATLARNWIQGVNVSNYLDMPEIEALFQIIIVGCKIDTAFDNFSKIVRRKMLTHSISAGLDYAAVGPEHSLLRELGRAEYSYVTDEQAIIGFNKLSQWEGILPALESSHAVAWMIDNADKFTADDLIILNVSGRGDKDVMQLADWKAKRK